VGVNYSDQIRKGNFPSSNDVKGFKRVGKGKRILRLLLNYGGVQRTGKKPLLFVEWEARDDTGKTT